MPDQDCYWTAKDIAEYINVSQRQVSERYAMMPGFPKAIRLPSPKGRGVYRWKRSEIIVFFDSLREAA